MENETKSGMEAILDTIAQAVVDEKYILPLAAWQTKSPISDEINTAYAEEIKEYMETPVAPCDNVTSLKLLKRFARKNFHDFWMSPVCEYLPAVSEGTMNIL